MGTLTFLSQAIDNYAGQHVNLTITNSSVVQLDGGTHWNVNELLTFLVRVENTRNLNMNGLKLHILGSKWAEVSVDGNNFSADFVSAARDAPARSTVTFGPFTARAMAATDGTSLASAHISTFNANLDHILNNLRHHSNSPLATLRYHIHAR